MLRSTQSNFNSRIKMTNSRIALSHDPVFNKVSSCSVRVHDELKIKKRAINTTWQTRHHGYHAKTVACQSKTDFVTSCTKRPTEDLKPKTVTRKPKVDHTKNLRTPSP